MEKGEKRKNKICLPPVSPHASVFAIGFNHSFPYRQSQIHAYHHKQEQDELNQTYHDNLKPAISHRDTRRVALTWLRIPDSPFFLQYADLLRGDGVSPHCLVIEEC